jgi:hypothetical protein
MAPPILPRDVAERPGATSASEAMTDLLMERAVDLLRLESGTFQKVRALLDNLADEITTQIAKINPTGTPRATYQRQRLQKLLEAVRAAIKASYRDTSTLMGREIRNVVDIESTWTGRAMNAATQAEFVDAGVTTAQLSTLVSDVLIQGAPTKEWWARQAGGLADRFADAMRLGVSLGENNSALVDRVIGTNDTPGIMNLAYQSAERLVRSSVQTAANVARDNTYDENADLLKAVAWSSTIDTRTSLWCITRDGLLYTPIEHKPIDHSVPWLQGPGRLHWGCRSTSIPIFKTWRDLGIDEDEVPDTTRASMDGQIPAQTTFEEWLRKQSATRQDTVLGEGRADLWRRDKITFRDLLDQSGRPLTTEELRAKAARRSAND